MSYQRVKYKLINNDIAVSATNPLWLTTDPENWETSDKTLKRSIKTFGVMTDFSRNLVFTKEGANFLKDAYLIKDIEADVTMEEWRFHPNTEVEYLHSTGDFDFSYYKADKLTVKIPFKTGGLNALIKSQLSQKFELERLESINGETIDALNTETVALTSRDILLISQLETSEQDAISESFRMKFDSGNSRTGSLGIPTEITINSDERLEYVIRDSSFTTTPNTGKALSMFYFNNDATKTLNINISVYCKIQEVKIGRLGSPFMKVDLVKFNNGLTLDLVSRTTLHTVTFSQINGWVIDFDYETDITLLAGESLSLQWYGGADEFGSGAPLFHDGYLRVDFEQTIATIDIIENSQFDNSQTKAVLFKEAGNKLMQIITGENDRYYSEFFSNGDFSKLGAALGFWIRGFNEKNIEWSLKDRLDTANVVCNTGWTIDIMNGKETLIEEDMKFFFQDAVAITLPTQVSNVTREVAKEFYYSNLEFGYKKPNGDNLYEEAMGLDEYNTKSGFTLPITRVDTTYKKISNDRADPYGKEFPRRKPQSLFPEEDTRYDKDKHLLDLKTGFGNALEERTWEDDFSEVPQNVYSPETATNLRLTPSNIKRRHDWFYGAGIRKQQGEKVRFANSVGNSELITKIAGEDERPENGDILINDLERPRFTPQWIKFDYKVDYFINQQVYGRTDIDGRLIPNYFFKVEFINEFNKKETGYLFELKPNKEGKWRLLKAL